MRECITSVPEQRRTLWTTQELSAVTPPLKINNKTSEEPLRKVEARENLKDVLVSLKAHFPLSTRMHNMVLLKLRGLDYHDIYIPEDNKDKHRLVLYKIKDREEFSVFCTPEGTDFLKEKLSRTSVINFSKHVSSCFIPYYLKEAVKEVLEARSGREAQEDITEDLVVINNDELLKWKESDWTFTIGSVRPLDVAGMTKSHQIWPLRHSIPLQVFLDIAKIAPTAGFYLHEDPSRLKNTSEIVQSSKGGEIVGVVLPVAVISVTCYGTLGMIYVEKEYRRLGMGPFMTMMCAKQMVMQGYEAIGTIYKCNTLWRTLLFRQGFEFSHEVVGMSVPLTPPGRN
ncbi:uncharacterized protein LOC143035697 [Oratosquilla oratoria]|uniref:uncharacterized protein LOC143035697 n=1 Tax=Oratosquilla oratoria TaxID=337810 RepID=UPI003F758028